MYFMTCLKAKKYHSHINDPLNILFLSPRYHFYPRGNHFYPRGTIVIPEVPFFSPRYHFSPRGNHFYPRGTIVIPEVPFFSLRYHFSPRGTIYIHFFCITSFFRLRFDHSSYLSLFRKEHLFSIFNFPDTI